MSVSTIIESGEARFIVRRDGGQLIPTALTSLFVPPVAKKPCATVIDVG